MQIQESIPRLEQPYTRCPVCGGTTEVNYEGYSECQSCCQQWTLWGEPRGKRSYWLEEMLTDR